MSRILLTSLDARADNNADPRVAPSRQAQRCQPAGWLRWLCLAALWSALPAWSQSSAPVDPKAADVEGAIGLQVIDSPQYQGSELRKSTIVPGFYFRWGRFSLATAGNFVAIGFSLAGAGPLPTPFGTVHLTPPIGIFPVQPADPNGNVAATLPIPAWAAGYLVHSHAAELLPTGSVNLTNWLTRTVL